MVNTSVRSDGRVEIAELHEAEARNADAMVDAHVAWEQAMQEHGPDSAEAAEAEAELDALHELDETIVQKLQRLLGLNVESTAVAA